jgi:hypothetical protein
MLTVIWIVHSWLLLQSRVPKVDSALDCPFLIAPSISCAQSWQCSGTVNCGHTRVKEQSRMDNPEHCQLWANEIEGAITNGQSRALSTLDTLILKEQSRTDNPETLTNKRCQWSGLSILDCSFNLVCPKLTVLWIVHSWLLLQSRVPKVDSALDCPFLIVVPSVFSNVNNQEWTIQSTVKCGHTRMKEQSRMDNPEHNQPWAREIEGAIKNGQSRALSTLGTWDWRSNQEWTIQSTVNLGHTRLKEQSRMDNPETLTNKR